MVKPEDVRKNVGKHVTLEVRGGTATPSIVRGKVTRTVEAADGLLVFVAPEGAPADARLSFHYHDILSITAQ